MKSWLIGLISVCIIIAAGIFLSPGYASDGSKGNTGEYQINFAESVIPAAAQSQESSTDEGISVEALKCTISNSGNYVIDLRLKNPGTVTKIVTISPSSTSIDVLPDQIKRYDLLLADEVSTLGVLADDGTELEANVPACIASGDSGTNAYSSLSKKNQKNLPPENLAPPEDLSPPAPVPELSTMILTLAGISGILLISRIMRN